MALPATTLMTSQKHLPIKKDSIVESMTIEKGIS